MELDLNVRPVVLIYISKNVSTEDIQYILYGLEEEKIPFSIEQRDFSTATEAAYVASNTSSLNVGIVSWYWHISIRCYHHHFGKQSWI